MTAEVSMTTVQRAARGTAAPPSPSRVTWTNALLSGAIVYALSYVVANDVVGASLYHGYSRVNQAVSELSAKGAASRPFLVGMFVVWAPAMIAFGVGVWQSARGRRALRIAGALFIAFGLTSLVWLPFPMSAREAIVRAATASNDVGHLVMSGVTVLLILAQIAFGAAAGSRRFRVYSAVTALIVLACGAITGQLSANIPEGKATPYLGLFERASIGAWLLWMTVLAVVLMRGPSTLARFRHGDDARGAVVRATPASECWR